MSEQLRVAFYHRHHKRLKDAKVLALVSVGIASNGLIVDRLQDVVAKRLNQSYWHYSVPVMKVVP